MPIFPSVFPVFLFDVRHFQAGAAHKLPLIPPAGPLCRYHRLRSDLGNARQ